MGARRAGKLADASLVVGSLVVGSLVVGSLVVGSLVGDSRAVDYPVAFLSLVDRACQVVQELVVLELVVLELVVLELADRAYPASEAELDDRAYQDGQDSVDFRYLRRAGCPADRGERVLQVASLRAAAPGEFPVETVAKAESRETFQVEWAVPDAALGGWFLEAVRRE